MAELFGVQVPAISKHLKKIFEDGELEESFLRESVLSEPVNVESGSRSQIFLQSAVLIIQKIRKYSSGSAV